MRIHRLRTRVLLAMGLSSSLVGCSKPKAGEPPPTTSTTSVATAAPSGVPTASVAATASATPTASANATANANPTASPLTTASAATPPVPVGIGRPSGGGGCGFTVLCRPAAAKARKDGAPKPFERCANTIAANNNAPTGPHGEGAFDADLTTGRRASAPGTCCYKAPRSLCGGGRPLRAEEGTPFVAAALARRDWLDVSVCSEDAAIRDAKIAARWLADAAAEHASVASFSRSSLELLSLGAPPELVRDTHTAALDEIEHARVCFALAARRGAPALGPGPLTLQRCAAIATTFEALVRETFLDGCVAETSAALDAGFRADDHGDACDDVERAALRCIAEDEERHAVLAWRIVSWALEAGGAETRAALQDTIREIERDADHDDVLRELVLPCARALLTRWSHPQGASLENVSFTTPS